MTVVVGGGWRAALGVAVAMVAGLTGLGADPVGAQVGRGMLVGVVTDEATGAPLAGMCVGAKDENTGVVVESPVTSADGRYMISDVPVGAYEIAFQDCRPAPLYRDELYPDHEIDFWTREGDGGLVPVGDGAAVVVDGSLELGGAITGTVTWAHNGLPARAVGVVPQACGGAFRALPPGHWFREAVGDFPEWWACAGEPDRLWFGAPRQPASPGFYVVGGLPAGDYVLALGGCMVDACAFLGGADRDAARVLPIVAGQAVVVDGLLDPRPSTPEVCEWGEAPLASARFDDVDDGATHSEAIGCLAHLGITEGTSRHRFSPDLTLSRGEAASLVARAIAHAGTSLPAAPPDAFDDDDGSPHEAALDQLAAVGVVSGTGTRTASPAAPVSRGQLATLVTRAYETVTGLDLRSGADHFTDDDGSVHEARIDHAATAGLVMGTGDGRFRPAVAVTRAQAATIVARLLGLLEVDLEGAA